MLCYAIAGSRIGTASQKRALRRWVMRMLEGSSSYEGWMATKHRKVWQRMQNLVWVNGARTANEPYRQGRLQWLDWMIAECEKEEAK